MTHPLRLSFTLNFSVFRSEVLQDPDEARKLAREVFDVEAHQVVPQERIQERIVEETIDDPMPHVMEETVEGVKHCPQEREQSCTVEQAVDAPVPRTKEEPIGAVKHIRQERVERNTVEQIVAVLAKFLWRSLGARVPPPLPCGPPPCASPTFGMVSTTYRSFPDVLPFFRSFFQNVSLFLP